MSLPVDITAAVHKVDREVALATHSTLARQRKWRCILLLPYKDMDGFEQLCG